MATKKAVTQPKPKKAKGPPPDPVNKQTLENTYREGELARQNRRSLDSCPYQITDPLWLSWERGWKAALFAESATPALLNALQQAGLTTGIPDLEELDANQRVAILDWLDTMPADEFSQAERAEFDARRPAFVSITSKVVPADEEFAELRVISVHGAAVADSKIPATEPVGSPSAEEPRAPVDALPPLQEIPPANDVEAELQDLLRQFDDVGVSIVEEQWRKLADGAQNICRRWLKGRLEGTKSPVPQCLLAYATPELKNEYAPYAIEQQEARRELMECKFLKPSVVDPGKDETVGAIKVVVSVPAEMLPGGKADRLLRYTKCLVRFGNRTLDDWPRNALPGMELAPIYEATSDISGYQANRHETKFTFVVSQDTLSIEAAFNELHAYADGCISVEVLGPAGEAKSDAEQETDPRQMQIPMEETEVDETPPESCGKKGGGQTAPEPSVPSGECLQFVLAVSGNFEITAKVDHDDDEFEGGWFVDIDAQTPDGFEEDNEFLGDTVQVPRVSPELALEAAVGRLIDHWGRWAGNEDAAAVLGQLRMWYGGLSTGKKAAAIQSDLKLLDAAATAT